MTTRTQAEAFNEIAYAAFSTHFRTVFAAQLTNANAHDKALEHWNANLPHIQTLWVGLTKGILINVQDAQRQGLLPPMIGEPAAALPGLGGTPHGQRPETQPAALAQRIAGQMRDRQDEAKARSPVREPDPALDVAPGLAIGRCTEDSPAAPAPDPQPDPGYSGGGGSDGGGGASGDY